MAYGNTPNLFAATMPCLIVDEVEELVMDVCSPKDGFVVKIHIEDGKAVSIGSPLLNLDTDEESRNRSRIETMDKVRAAMASQYEGEEERIARVIAQANVDTCKYKVDLLENILNDIKDQQKVGQTRQPDVDHALIELQQAKLDHAKSQAELKKLDFSLSRHKEISNFVADQLKSEKAFIEIKTKRLVVVAPTSGIVRLQVGINSFRKLGDVLLTVE